jgi:hypothetical protein
LGSEKDSKELAEAEEEVTVRVLAEEEVTVRVLADVVQDLVLIIKVEARLVEEEVALYLV